MVLISFREFPLSVKMIETMNPIAVTKVMDERRRDMGRGITCLPSLGGEGILEGFERVRELERWR